MTLPVVLTRGFVRSYWMTMRPYLLFVSGITGLAGLSFAPPLPAPATLLVFGVFFLSYGFGQALTDCFQTDTDALSSPYRPLVRGTVTRRDVAAVSLACLCACGCILGAFAPGNLILASACVAGLATYTYFKRRWWGGPFYNGWIVAVLFVMGYYSGSPHETVHGSDAFMLTLVSVLFGYANFVLVGYFKDVEADRRTGYRTFVVEFGREAAAVASDMLAIVFVITGSAAFMLAAGPRADAGMLASAVFLAASVCAVILTQLRLHGVETDETAYVAVVPSVHAYLLMLAAISSANMPAWIPALVVYYVGFTIVALHRPEVTQI